MGYGQFVGNMSVHWAVDHEANQDMVVDATDDAPYDNHKVHVKKRCQGKDPKRGDNFTVVLRFDLASATDARDALIKAVEALEGKGEKETYVTLTLPALRRRNPTAAPPPEVRVSW